jgi:multidrug resistance protein
MKYESATPYFILFSLWLLVFAASSQIMIIAPILPEIGNALNTPVELLGNLVTVYAVMVGIFAIIMGPFSDKIGRRKILLLGTGFMAIFLFCHTLVVDFKSFLVIRAMAGMAGGVLSGAAVAYVGDYFPYEKRGWANGWVMSGIAVGQILGIPLGTFLAEQFGFRSPFLVFGIVMSLTFVLIYFKVPQPNVELHTDKLTVISTFTKYLKLLKRKDVSFVALCYLLMFLSLSVFIIYLPTWLEDSFDSSLTTIGYIFAVGGVANVVAGPSSGWISDKIGRKNMIITSCLGLSILMTCTTFFVTELAYAFILFPLAMILIAMRISPFQALSSELVKSNNRGTMMSLLVAIGQVGYGLGGTVAGPLYSVEGYASNTYFGAAAIFLTALIVWKFVPEPELRTSATSEPSILE